MSTAAQRDVVGTRAGALAADPTFGPALAADEAAGRSTVAANERFGERRGLVQAVRSSRAAFVDENPGVLREILAFVRGGVERARTSIDGGDTALRLALQEESAVGALGAGGALSADLESRIESYLRRQADASERAADAVEANARPAGE